MIYNIYRSVLRNKCSDYDHLWNYEEFPAGTTLLREGEISKKIFSVEKGCVRIWFNNKGKDVTVQFFFENESVSSIESFRKQIPSLFSIETVERSSLHWIWRENLALIINENPEIRSHLFDIVAERQLTYSKQFLSLLRYTPPERYLNLLEERPEIISRVPLHFIASYLGITPVSLSRIRNRLARTKKS